MLPFDTRYRSHPSINYPLRLAAGETAHLYLRAQTSGSMQLPLRISSEREFGERAATESIRNGLYYGLILAMVFFNGFLFFATSDRSYVSYCGYLLGYLAVQMSLNGALYFVQMDGYHPDGYCDIQTENSCTEIDVFEANVRAPCIRVHSRKPLRASPLSPLIESIRECQCNEQWVCRCRLPSAFDLRR